MLRSLYVSAHAFYFEDRKMRKIEFCLKTNVNRCRYNCFAIRSDWFFKHANLCNARDIMISFAIIDDSVIVYRKFAEILTIMEEDWNDCCNSDINMRETTCKAKLAGRITNAMFTLHTLTIVGYSVGIFLADVDVTDHQSELPLLLKVNLPININTERRYKTLLSAQFIHLILSGCGTGLLNALLLTLVSCNARVSMYHE